MSIVMVVHYRGYLSIVLVVFTHYTATIQSRGGIGVCERSPGAYLAWARTLVTVANTKRKSQTISFSFLEKPHFS